MRSISIDFKISIETNLIVSLEQAGIKIIQINEAALREGLPLRQSDWPTPPPNAYGSTPTVA